MCGKIQSVLEVFVDCVEHWGVLAHLEKFGLLMQNLASLEKQHFSLSCKKRGEEACSWTCICLKLFQEGNFVP